jgi:hypothetical protein
MVYEDCEKPHFEPYKKEEIMKVREQWKLYKTQEIGKNLPIGCAQRFKNKTQTKERKVRRLLK